MDEHLVDYLLETLDPMTHQRVEGHLRQDPDARAKLDLLRQAMAPLAEDAGDPDPPPGLAMRALARVAEHRCALPAAPPPSPCERAFAGRPGLTAFADGNDRGEFPKVEATGPSSVAGIFVPALLDRGLALDVSIGCPA